MYDISVFIKELKGRFAQWYNQRHDRYGYSGPSDLRVFYWKGARHWPLWLLTSSSTRSRAGLCDDPKDYRYCGYAEALAKGSLLARQGIRTILGQPETIFWKELSREYRKIPLCQREL
jgi:putative transposase